MEHHCFAVVVVVVPRGNVVESDFVEKYTEGYCCNLYLNLEVVVLDSEKWKVYLKIEIIIIIKILLIFKKINRKNN